ncbi:MAG: hypothetical protein H7096_01345 [Flavobacterium sp.]|nr:hypothetical protein [Pedobacter sp.]
MEKTEQSKEFYRQLDRQLDNIRLQREILDELERFLKQQRKESGLKPKVDKHEVTAEDIARLFPKPKVK